MLIRETTENRHVVEMYNPEVVLLAQGMEEILQGQPTSEGYSIVQSMKTNFEMLLLNAKHECDGGISSDECKREVISALGYRDAGSVPFIPRPVQSIRARDLLSLISDKVAKAQAAFDESDGMDAACGAKLSALVEVEMMAETFCDTGAANA